MYLDSTIYDSMDRSLTLPSINFGPATLRRRGRKQRLGYGEEMITLDRVRGIEGMKDKDRGKGGEIE